MTVSGFCKYWRCPAPSLLRVLVVDCCLCALNAGFLTSPIVMPVPTFKTDGPSSFCFPRPVFASPFLLRQAFHPIIMAPNCPKCGAHLSIALAGDSTSTPAPVVVKDATDTPQRKEPNQAEQPNEPKQHNELKVANAPNAPIPPSFTLTEAHVRRLAGIMFAPLKGPSKPKQRTLRPVVSTEPDVGASTDRHSLDMMDLTVRTMLTCMHHRGQPSPDALLEARRRGRGEHQLPGRMELVFEALGAVVYDMM